MTVPLTTSTVGPAITALQAKFQGIADANSGMDLGVYLGQLLGSGTLKNNFLSVGDPTGADTGIFAEYVQGQMGPGHRTEAYLLRCWLRTWRPSNDPTDTISDATALLSAVTTTLGADLNGSGALGSGTWAIGEATNPTGGRIGGKGWGVVIQFDVAVSNVIIANR